MNRSKGWGAIPVGVIYCLLIMFTSTAEAQFAKLKPVPLFDFFQKNFDSTVIWFSYSFWNREPNYQIVSHIGNRSFHFTYQVPYSYFEGRSIPKVLEDRFSSLLSLYRSTLPDTNQFFLPKVVHYTQANTVWDVLKTQNIWNLQDDNTDSSKCMGGAMDADEQEFILITKSAIRPLYFYDMSDCPQNINRQKVRKIITGFISVFGSRY